MKRQILLFALGAVLMCCLPASLQADSNHKKTVVVMLGAPGAGKGTQAVRLSERFSIPQVSTGDLFRENLKKETSIGKKAKAYMEQGKLVPDPIVLKMLFDRLSESDCHKGYILDGFPRNIQQAEILSKRLQGKANIVVISLEAPDELILERLSNRLTCEGCGAIYHKITLPPQKEGICDKCSKHLVQRKDDTETVIKERLAIFHEQTAPLKKYYQEKGLLISVDSAKSKDETSAQIDTALEPLLVK